MAPPNESSPDLRELDSLERRLGQGAQGGSLPETEVRKAPGFLQYMPALIREFWAHKAYCKMEEDGSLSMEGFYKNGPMRLEMRENGHIVAIDKRGRATTISSFEDLIKLNFFWWKQSNTKTSYVEPGRPWIDHFIERKWVRRRVIFQPADADDGEQAQA